MKYKNQIIQSAEEWVRKNGLMDYGGGQLKDFIKYLGIDDKTWRKWYAEKEEFRRAIDRAKEDYKRSLAIELHQTLAQAAMGGEHEETTTEYRPNSKEPDRPTITKMVKNMLSS